MVQEGNMQGAVPLFGVPPLENRDDRDDPDRL